MQQIVNLLHPYLLFWAEIVIMSVYVQKGNRGIMKETQENWNQTQNQQTGGYYGNRPNLTNKGPSKLRQQFGRGMTYFLVIAASIVFYFALLRLTNLSDVFAKIITVLKPILYGLVIAYVLNPIVKKVDGILIPRLEKRMKNQSRANVLSRTAGVFISLVILIMIITGLCNMMIPELYKSIRDLVVTLPGQLNDLMAQINTMIHDESTTGTFLKTAMQEGMDMFQKWLRTDLLEKANELMSSLTVGVFNIVSELFNLLIGLIVSVYVLFSKEVFMRQTKKMVYALLTPHNANLVLHFTKKSNEIFGGFIIGKVIDSAIIGVLCFVGLSLLKMPYVLLVSVIVGVTNVIPFFGPYIGAIPSAILIFLTNPLQGLYFLIFILVLQQVDGNLIGPKILGNSTGLSAFWVIFAILLGGGLFGFLGMLMGVPTFAVIYYIIQMIINHKLERKNLPQESDYYDEYSYVDDQGNYILSEQHDERKEKDKKEE